MNEVSLRFIVPGRPRPKERHRWDPRHQRTYTPHGTSAYEKTVAAYALKARQDLEVSWPMRAEYQLVVTAYFGRGPWPDIDNVGKAIADGLTGVLWDNDRFVRQINVGMAYAREQRAEVRVTATLRGAAQLVVYRKDVIRS